MCDSWGADYPIFKENGATGLFFSPIPTQQKRFHWGLIDQCEKIDGKVFYHRKNGILNITKNENIETNGQLLAERTLCFPQSCSDWLDKYSTV